MSNSKTPPAGGDGPGVTAGMAPDGDAEAAEERLLNQDEIDSLLGLGGGDGDDESEGRHGLGGGHGNGGPVSTGLSVLLDSSSVSYERLPMLEVVFDRLVRMLSTTLRNFTSENVEITVDRIDSLRFGDYLESVPLPAMIGVFRAVEWDNYGLLTVDSPLIYAMVDVLLGGRGASPMRSQSRPYTTIERALIERMITLVLQDMAIAFAPLSKVEFRFERLETNPRFVAIARPTNAAALFRLQLDLMERGGMLNILLPYETLEPVRELLLQMSMGEKFGRDAIWEGHLAREVLVTDIELEALLDEQTLPLRHVMQLKIGSTLLLHARKDHPITLRCGQLPLLRGRIGRVGDRVAVRVEERLERNEERP